MTTHGVYGQEGLTWCEVPRIGMKTSEKISEVTCRRCKKVFDEFKKDLVVTMERRRGAPVTSGRRSAGSVEIKIRLSADEVKAIDDARGGRTRPGFITWAALEKAGYEP